MKLSQRLQAFAQLGENLQFLDNEKLTELSLKARDQNPWFTENSTRSALDGLQAFLNADDLGDWTSLYPADPKVSKSIGLVLAGNLPLVGFHDLLCVLVSGHSAQVKLSSQDNVLMTYLIEEINRIEPAFKDTIRIVERLSQAEAVIATGSDNTSRYFNFYFRNIPHIIRKNRTSCAILTGDEADEELTSLGQDIFWYFGLGCRNVSKIYTLPKFGLDRLLSRLDGYQPIINHHKYANNYDYNKTIYLLTQQPHLDNGFLLLKSETSLVSPIAVLYYQECTGLNQAKDEVSRNRDKIQCVVAKPGLVENSTAFGQAQFPRLLDYADNVDTMKFLEQLG